MIVGLPIVPGSEATLSPGLVARLSEWLSHPTGFNNTLIRACDEIGAAEGIFAAPEGGAAWAATKLLAEGGKLGRGERIVVFNTGSGFKYL